MIWLRRFLYILLILALGGLTAWGLVAWRTKNLAASYGDGCLLPVTPSVTGPVADAVNAASAAQDDLGLQVAVADRSGAVRVFVAGAANATQGCPVTPEHLFPIGSVTKFITAVRVLQLVDAGVLDLDAPAANWLDVPLDPRITLRDLLSHRSGLPDYTNTLGFLLRFAFWPDADWNPHEMAAQVTSAPLQAEPGTSFAYANANFLLLGLIIENATARPFAESLRTDLTEPLGLVTLHLGGDQTPDERIAQGVDRDVLPLAPRDMTAFRKNHLASAFTAGGVVSDAADLARFGQRLFAGAILSEAALAEMLDAPPVQDRNMPRTTAYGLGLRVMATASGGETLGHSGTIPGYNALLEYDPKTGYTVAILANRSLADLTAVSDAVRAGLKEEQ